MKTIPSTNKTEQPTVSPNQKPNWLARLLIAGFAFLIILSIYLSATHVEGVEFNPNNWQIRRFSFRADPFTRLQLTKIRRDTSGFQLDPTIKTHLEVDSNNTHDRWDLVEITQFGSRRLGPAFTIVHILSRQGQASPAATSSNPHFWAAWSIAQSKKASHLWPAVQKMINQESYEVVPDLLELALIEVDDSDFAELVNKKVRSTTSDDHKNLPEF